MPPLISAIMLVTHPRRAAMCAEACHSFVHQTYPNTEMVVVNDGDPLVSLDPRVRVVPVPKGLSIGAKRNAGVLAARGALVATWDDDDLSFPERLAQHYDDMQRDGATQYHRSSRMWLGDPKLRVVGLIENASYATSLVDREALLEIGMYPDISYLEDMEVFIRLGLRGIKRTSSPEPLYVHRRHGSNISSAYSAQSLESHRQQSDVVSDAEVFGANRRAVELLNRPQRPVLASANGEPLMFQPPAVTVASGLVNTASPAEPATTPASATTPAPATDAGGLDRVVAAVERAANQLVPLVRDQVVPIVQRDRELQRTVGEAAGRGLARELKPVLWFIAGTAFAGVAVYAWNSLHRDEGL